MVDEQVPLPVRPSGYVVEGLVRDRLLDASVIEKLIDHQISMERGEQRLQWAGLCSAVVVILAFLVVSAWLISGNHDVAGSVLGTVDLATIATVFVTRQRANQA